jgi:hypothetical protein
VLTLLATGLIAEFQEKISGPVGLVVGASIAKPRSIMVDLIPVPCERNQAAEMDGRPQYQSRE